MDWIRPIFATLAGLGVATAVYAALVSLVLVPIQQASGDSPEAWLGTAFLVILPLGLFAGSLVAGYLHPIHGQSALWQRFLEAPALVVLLIAIPTWLTMFGVFLPLVAFFWFAICFRGLRFGSKLKQPPAARTAMAPPC